MKQVIVLQGIPGSGKSTWAEQQEGYVVSADHYFIQPTGEYAFVPALLGKAHGWCFRKYIEALQQMRELVVVDNTNTRVSEVSPYMLGAAAFGYEARIKRFAVNVEVAAQRNVHGVPLETCKRMNDKLLREQWLVYWVIESVPPQGE